MDGITFASTPLAEVARRVVVEYLGTASGEAFLLVTDDGVAPELADALMAAAAAAGADPTHARIAARERSGEEPPPPVVGAMAAADVCLCVATRSIYHTAAKGRAQAAGTRGCFNAPADLGAWTSGAMVADYAAIRAVAERVAGRLRGAEWVTVTSPAGSDITVSTKGREPKGWYTGIVRRPGEISAFPGGEVSFPPVEGTSNGVIVFERVMTDIGGLSEPVVVTVEDGLAVAIEGGEEAARLRDMIDGVPGATNLAELGIGLNPAARVSDDITESKKKQGTAHFALGDNAGGYGGVVESPVHLDGMLFGVTITVDGEEIVRDGEVLL
ncbi:MAG TPA: aminopeptidase [Gaiellales bacterium]|jgi:leucyl aminopeptidase (aminopeptidase T)|nr:aminopeptidase [Gaiellales bacterium]